MTLPVPKVRNRNRRTADRNVLDIGSNRSASDTGEGAGCMHGGITNMGTGGQTGLVYTPPRRRRLPDYRNR